jgi:hypothetical protein
MISVSLSRDMDPAMQRHFAPVAPQGFPDFCSIICTSVWSPILWKDGLRAKREYESCDYIVLDCDDGRLSLAEAVEWCRDLELAHIVGTTRSHQKEKRTAAGKVTPACDRFRMLLKGSWTVDGQPAGAGIRDRELFEYNMERFAEYFHADPSCKDAARFFYPCREIVSTGDGKPVPWLTKFDPDYVPEATRFAARRERLKQYSKMVLPQWIRNIIVGAEIIPAGERHKTCYRLGAWLAVIGFTHDETVRMLMRTRLSDIGEQDLARAVGNGRAAEGFEK